MTAEVFQHDAIIDGDIRPIDDLSVEDRPDGPVEMLDVDDTPSEVEQETIEVIKGLLLEAEDLKVSSNAKRLRGTTRKEIRTQAGDLGSQADTLIAELIGCRLDNPDDEATIALRRRSLRDKALSEREEERRRQKTAALARAAEKSMGLDAQRLAAGEGVKHPWDDD